MHLCYYGFVCGHYNNAAFQVYEMHEKILGFWAIEGRKKIILNDLFRYLLQIIDERAFLIVT